MTIENSYNFRPVSDEVTTSGIVPAPLLDTLGDAAYRAVINLLPDSSKHAIADEREIVESQGIEYIHIPVDFGAPKAADFAAFSQAMERLEGARVHVHCAANYRVSAFYARYALERGIWEQAEAAAFVADIWDPAAYPAWQDYAALFQRADD